MYVKPWVQSLALSKLGMMADVSDPRIWWRWRQENLKFKVILELYIKFSSRLGYMKLRWGVGGQK